MPPSKQPIFALTDADRRLIQEILSREKSRPRNTTGRAGTEWSISYAPETYIARTHPEGIPGLVEEPGTGVNDIPGYADCDIFQVIYRDGVPELQGLESFTQRVHNLSMNPVVGGGWVLITRDKAGEWWVVESRGAFNALLVGKTYTVNQFIAYSWIRVLDTTDPSPIVYTEQEMHGGPGRNPAYHERNLDLPVVTAGADLGTGTGTLGQQIIAAHELSVVRLRAGYGPIPGTSSVLTPPLRYYLFDTEAWVDLFRRTGMTDDYGEIAYHRYLNQNTNAWQDGREVRIVEAE